MKQRDSSFFFYLMAPAATLLPLSLRWWYITTKTLFLPTAKNVVKNIKTFSAKGTYGEPILYHLRYYHFKYCIPKVKVPPVIFTDEELQTLSTPTFVLVGDQEVIYNPQKAIKRAMELIPNCAGEILPQCGHSIPTDQPELLARKMKEFLLK
ncbi:MAG TPA: alpha/beta hydrolase [Bacillota bacterium]|nr:alpha/beta hydrolase [Bacillota bacterium]